jgi:peptide/nickel transport system permease protein
MITPPSPESWPPSAGPRSMLSTPEEAAGRGEPRRRSRSEAVPPVIVAPSLLRRAWTTARRNPAGVASAVVVLAVVAVALFADVLAPFDPARVAAGPRLAHPSARFPFGTDHLGRDLLSRIIAGTRVALALGVASILTSTVLGTAIGILAGWFEGKVDQVLSRLVDALMAIPALVLALALVAVLGPGFGKIIVALTAFSIPITARTVRGAVLSAKQSLYIEVALALGSTTPRLLLRHILPNVTAPLIIVMTLQLGTAILGEAALSFLGLGVQPPAVSWGQMLSGPARRVMEQAPWLVIFPTLAISVTVLALNFLGDALRDLLDPKLRGSE